MLLAVLKRVLFSAGVGTLAYAGVLIAESHLTQRYEALKFDRSLAVLVHSPDKVVLPGDPIGKLTIGSVGISAMVLEGADSETLNVAPGHIPGTALPQENGNVAIAGHRDTFFRNLEKLRDGDSITLTTLTGVYWYRVDSMEVVDPARLDVLAPTKEPTLTLVTCYPFHMIGPAPKRFIVRGHLVRPSVKNSLES